MTLPTYIILLKQCVYFSIIVYDHHLLKSMYGTRAFSGNLFLVEPVAVCIPEPLS